MRLVRLAATAEQPWVNGGGRTRTLHDDGRWRLSIAEISRPGPFSYFRGYDRVLVGMVGAVRVKTEARTSVVSRGQRISFRGEEDVWAEPEGHDTVSVVNVMARRGECSTRVTVLPCHSPSPPADALVVLAGRARYEGRQLHSGDVLLAAPRGALQGGDASVIAITIREDGPGADRRGHGEACDG